MPVRAELFAQLGELAHRAQQCLSRRAERSRERFDLIICRWPEPQAIFAPMVQRLDEIGERLPRSLARASGKRARGPQPGRRTAAPRSDRSADRAPVRTGWRRRGRWPSWPSRAAAVEGLCPGDQPRRRDSDSRARCARGRAADAALRRRQVDASVDGTATREPVEPSAANPTSLRSRACSTRRRSRPMLMTRQRQGRACPLSAGNVPPADRRRPCRLRGDRRAHIPLHELRYWSVERQEPYVDAEASLKAETARRSASRRASP